MKESQETEEFNIDKCEVGLLPEQVCPKEDCAVTLQ